MTELTDQVARLVADDATLKSAVDQIVTQIATISAQLADAIANSGAAVTPQIQRVADDLESFTNQLQAVSSPGP